MVRLSGVQHATSTYAIQGARAYQAAKAGIEWAIASIPPPSIPPIPPIDSDEVCNNIKDASPLSFPDINGFLITIKTCDPYPFSEGADSHVVYKITALSEYGAYNSANYISRNIEVSIVN